LEIFPIDLAVNVTLAAASRLGSTSVQIRDLMVYNCTSNSHPFVFNDLKKAMMSAFKDTPFNGTLWYPSVLFVSNRLAFDILDYIFHYIPVVTADGVLRLIGRGSIMRTYLKLKKLRDLTCETIARDYCISTMNTMKLYENLTPEDQESFNFNILNLNYDDYVPKGIYGMRRYGAGEKDEDLPGARKRLQRLRVVYIGVWALLVLALAFFIMLVLPL
jgi:fatty acyl-CoA reductase